MVLKELGERELAIKINIAGRNYPLTIKANEEELVRKAGVLLNKRIEEFKSSYAADIKDLLAMSALMFAIDSMRGGKNEAALEYDIISVLQEIDLTLDKVS
ncbi:MAG TPA: cell division protein ZapA [Bacteroidetes bacterium]|nr:cell division protein ZapA [Bacteroidota bacterium]